MRIVFFGTGEFAAPALSALLVNGHTLASVVSQPDRPAGRGRKIQPTPVRVAAEEHRLRHIQTDNVNQLNLADALGGAEIGIAIAFGQKIGNAVLDALPYGCINLHGSLLPKYRGAAPYQWAIINGETITGVTVFQLNERWDAGAVWSRREVPIGETETAAELHDRLSQVGAELLIDALTDIQCGAARPIPQDDSQASFAPKLTKEMSRIDWSRPAFQVVRAINGLWTWPGAAGRLEIPGQQPERIQLARAKVTDVGARPEPDFPPGAFLPDGSVQTGVGRLRLLEVRPAGGKLMSFEAFAHGRELKPPARLLPLEET